MNHNQKPTPVIPKNRPDPMARMKAIRARQVHRNKSQWKSLVIGVFAIGGVFLYLELSKPAPLPLGVALQKATANPIESVTTMVPSEATEPTEEPAGLELVNPAKDTSVQSAAAAKPEDAVISGTSESELLNKESGLVLTGLDGLRENALRRDKELLKRAIDGKAWDAYRGLLAKSIAAGIASLPTGQGVNRFDAVWKEPALYQAMLRWQVLGRFSESEISARAHDSYTGEVLVWLLNHNPAMEEVLLTIKPVDDGGKVLGFLIAAWPNTSGGFDKYFSLALACAVVFDREVRIPNPVAGQYGVQPVVEPMRRYLWFIAKNDKGQLTAPVHHSSARDLVWVVCAPVSDSELEWSIAKMNLSRKNWGNAYGMIEYLMERAVKGLNPYKEYTFAEILKEGGICGDQSYFCTNTARAQGIPAMTFSGETDLGGHAWVGLKIQSDEWTTGVGRIGGASKGETDNPQTGKSISEQEVQLWSDRAHQSPVATLAVARHLWLADYFAATGKDADAAATVRLANHLGPSFTETWAALYALLQKQMKLTGEPAAPSNLEDWKSFAKMLRQQFKDNPRMAGLAADAENDYIFPYGTDDNADRMLLRERRRIERNSGEQKDLIAESLKREADLIQKRGDATANKEISNLYDSALRKYGGSITGFKMMAEDYFSFLKGDPELSRKAARDIELAFKRVVETGTKDWFRAQTESSIYKMICGYYRATGDEERAIMLEKRVEVLLKRAERSAL